ncbi:MAG: phosphonate ABC transporter, permease protein PhnE [Candidatus Pacebacteria bacterium]|nr:phosphonate ABC transporter, permease protein PhnE [Candidatus Paceibacterota bacterium]
MHNVRTCLIWAAILLLWGFAAYQTDLTPGPLLEGLPAGWRYLQRVFPPDWSVLPRILGSLGETYLIAIAATGLSASVALPLSFLGAFNINPHRWLRLAVRQMFNLCRGFPDVFLALLLVSMVGFGPLPAVIALAIHNIGTLGRYFAEGTEAAGDKLREIGEAMSIDGATKLQVIKYGYIPCLSRLYVGYTLYYFEYSVRAGSYLGLVGAGGLGVFIKEAVGLFRYRQIGTIIIVIFAIALTNDLLSQIIRCCCKTYFEFIQDFVSAAARVGGFLVGKLAITSS